MQLLIGPRREMEWQRDCRQLSTAIPSVGVPRPAHACLAAHRSKRGTSRLAEGRKGFVRDHPGICSPNGVQPANCASGKHWLVALFDLSSRFPLASHSRAAHLENLVFRQAATPPEAGATADE